MSESEWIMPESSESSVLYPSNHAAAVERFRNHFPALLSIVSGMVDVIGYLSLKVFTAHVTGNLVLIAAMAARGGPLIIDQILAVPVFILAVAAVWLVCKASNRRGAALIKPLLLFQFLLLTVVLVVAVIYDPAANPRGSEADMTASIAVSAMACQFALLRLAMPVAPSTAVMTGNLANVVLAFLDTVSHSQLLMKESKDQLRQTLPLVIGFLAGCMVGAAAIPELGNWAWSFPAALAGLIVALAPSAATSPEVIQMEERQPRTY